MRSDIRFAILTYIASNNRFNYPYRSILVNNILRESLFKTWWSLDKGLNNALKLLKRQAYGSRNFAHFRLRVLLLQAFP